MPGLQYGCRLGWRWWVKQGAMDGSLRLWRLAHHLVMQGLRDPLLVWLWCEVGIGTTPRRRRLWTGGVGLSVALCVYPFQAYAVLA
jgi:hypothetical protein